MSDKQRIALLEKQVQALNQRLEILMEAYTQVSHSMTQQANMHAEKSKSISQLSQHVEASQRRQAEFFRLVRQAFEQQGVRLPKTDNNN